MNELRRTVSLALALVLLTGARGFAQSDTPKKPLTEEALLKLIKGDLEEEVIATLIKKRGVSFTADAASLKRLKEGGASALVLTAVKAAGTKEKPPAEDSDKEDKAKVLATAKHEIGLIVEVTEVKPDADRPLLTIRWRYRNPTKRTIQMFGQKGPLRLLRSQDERARFIDGTYFLSGSQDDRKQYRHSVVKDTGNKDWCKPTGVDPVQIGPGEVYEFWAKFALPEETTKKISLQLHDVPMMDSIPVQWGAKD